MPRFNYDKVNLQVFYLFLFFLFIFSLVYFLGNHKRLAKFNRELINRPKIRELLEKILYFIIDLTGWPFPPETKDEFLLLLFHLFLVLVFFTYLSSLVDFFFAWQITEIYEQETFISYIPIIIFFLIMAYWAYLLFFKRK